MCLPRIRRIGGMRLIHVSSFQDITAPIMYPIKMPKIKEFLISNKRKTVENIKS